MKSEFPYLVDMSITHACPFGCEFCYTSSKNVGNHANIRDIEIIAKALADSRVLEVVFGGGEPTLYSDGKYCDFSYVAKIFKNMNFKVGVTTKNYMLHKHKAIYDILKNVDSIAFSCNNVDELKKVVKFQKAVEGFSEGPRVYVQCIFGLTPYEDFKSFMNKAAKLRFHDITLLGYKDFGFGSECKSFGMPEEWIDFMLNFSEKNYVNIGIDSVMARKWGKQLEARGVRAYMLSASEGEQTCYIDAVDKVVKPSSFTNEKYAIPLSDKRWNAGQIEMSSEDFLKIYNMF